MHAKNEQKSIPSNQFHSQIPHKVSSPVKTQESGLLSVPHKIRSCFIALLPPDEKADTEKISTSILAKPSY